MNDRLPLRASHG